MHALSCWCSPTPRSYYPEKYRFRLLPSRTRIWILRFCYCFPRRMEWEEAQYHWLPRFWWLCGRSDDRSQCDRHGYPPHQWCFRSWSRYTKPLPLHGKTQQARHFPRQSTWPRELRLRRYPWRFANHLRWKGCSRAISFGNWGWIQ